MQSRTLQNLLHTISGSYNIFLLITGIMIGKGDWFQAFLFGGITVATGRLIAEIEFRKISALLSEKKCSCTVKK